MSVASIYRGTTPSVTLHVRGLDLSDASYDNDGNLVQFTNTKDPTSAYMRLSAHEIDADSVITVNEEIK